MLKRNIAVVIGLTGALTTVGVAHAGWLVSGFATGDVTTGNPQLTVQANEVDGAYPGGQVPSQITVTNSNTFPVQFGNVTFDNVTVDAAHSDCPTNVLSVAWSDPGKFMLPQESDSFEADVAMSPSAPQACMGATFHVVWRADGTVGTPS